MKYLDQLIVRIKHSLKSYPIFLYLSDIFREKWRLINGKRKEELQQQVLALIPNMKLRGQLRQAEAILRSAGLPKYQMWRQLADIKLLSGDSADAVVLYWKILKASKFRKDSVVSIGHALAVAGYLDESTKIYAEAMRQKKDSDRGKIKFGRKTLQVLPYYWVDRIGHLAFLDSFIKMMIMGWTAPRPVILLAPRSKVANMAYLNHWGRYIAIEFDEHAISQLSRLTDIFEDQYFGAYKAPSGQHCWWIKAAWAAQLEWDSQGRKPLLKVTPSEELDGLKFLRAHGIGPQDWFVCLHVRESGFHGDGKGHSQHHRDSNIKRYSLAINEIVKRGGWVIRMGDPGMKPLLPARGVIDYAGSEFKSEIVDIFLSARCRFFIATNSGLGVVPSTFGTPAVVVDYMPLANEIYIKNGCFIPRLVWSSHENRYLTFDECMETPLGTTHTGETFFGFEIRPNTELEIKELIIEMMDRLDGVFDQSASDINLQNKFNEIREFHGVVSNAPIGRDFLRKHAALLKLAETVRQRKNRAELISSFEIPENTALNNLARAKEFIELGAFEFAAACVAEAQRLDPLNEEATLLLRTIHVENAFCSSDLLEGDCSDCEELKPSSLVCVIARGIKFRQEARLTRFERIERKCKG